MENTPNISATYTGNRITSPVDRSEPYEIKTAKRRAWAQWYEARKAQVRDRYRQRAMRQAQESKSGAMTFDYMGRMAVNSAANAEQNPAVRNQRRAYLMRKWREFMRRSF